MNVLFLSMNDPVEPANAIIIVERGAKVPWQNYATEYRWARKNPLN